MQSALPGDALRIVTWNIHGAIGADRQCRPERIASLVKAMQPDIVALQEVDGRTHLGRHAAAFETFAELLGGHIVEARLFGRPQREHGNLLWSRWPIARQIVHLLPGGLEQRGLIEAEFELPDGTSLRVFATHLGLSPITRRAQARAIARHVGGSASPAIVVGDFNEWAPSGGVHRHLAPSLPNVLRPATWPARRPLVPLDRIYASAGLGLRSVPALPEVALASDHLPIIADLILPAR